MVKNGKHVNCSDCGKLIYRQNYLLKQRDLHFCSKKCHATYKTGLSMGGKTVGTCRECKNSFETLRYLLRNGGSKFCSHRCYSLYKSKVGNTPRTGPTKPERLFKSFLEELEIPYIQYKLVESEQFGRCYYDFYIPKNNLLIEIDGDYWHGNPLLYKTLNEQQKKCQKRDVEKNINALEKGYKLLRIWETDLKVASRGYIKNLIEK